jgi:DNA-binding NarL/FixJ family response regulator
MQDGPIWIVDEDLDDHELIQELFKDLSFKNELVLFTTAKGLLVRLDNVEVAPFIIICDVNLAGMSGFELREKLLSTPNKKYHSVPFIFWSVAPSEAQIQQAYELKAHGFFLKESTYEEWRQSLINIIKYWQKSLTPSKEDQPAPSQL